MQPYTLRANILDPMEQSLYRALTLVLCQRALLFAKINLGDLFTTSAYGATATDLAQLAHYPVDFVLCDREAMRPLAVIFVEAEGTSRHKEETEKSAQICAAAGLPVVRLQRQHSYMMPYLTSIIEPLLTVDAANDAYSNGDRRWEAGAATITHALHQEDTSRHTRRLPAYPGYGALRTLANKLS